MLSYRLNERTRHGGCHNLSEAENHKPYLDTVLVPAGVNSRLQPSSGVPVAARWAKGTAKGQDGDARWATGSGHGGTVARGKSPKSVPLRHITWQEVVTGVRRRAYTVSIFVIVCMPGACSGQGRWATGGSVATNNGGDTTDGGSWELQPQRRASFPSTHQR